MSNANNEAEKLPTVDEQLPYSTNLSLVDLGIVASEMLYSSANFYRTSDNTNIIIPITLGTDITPGTIYKSNDIYLPISTFNDIRSITEINYPDYKDALISTDLTFYHDVNVQYKLEKSDGTNYSNNRNVRMTLVKNDGTVYHSSLYADNQPPTGVHSTNVMRGHIIHTSGDIVKLKINVYQDIKNIDNSNSKLTIFRICWTILGLKSGA